MSTGFPHSFTFNLFKVFTTVFGCRPQKRAFLYSSGTLYFPVSESERWPLISFLLRFFTCFTFMSIACLVYWYCNNLQNVCGYYPSNFTSIIRHWYSYKKYQQFSIDTKVLSYGRPCVKFILVNIESIDEVLKTKFMHVLCKHNY